MPEHKLKKGDRIVVPFNINRGKCRMCKLGNRSCCERSNRNVAMRFGYMMAGVGPVVAPEGMTGDQLLFPDGHPAHGV